MKKITALFLSLILVISLAACGKTPSNDNTTQNSSAQEEPQTSDTSAPASSEPTESTEPAGETGTGNKKILVVYYSASGNTERVAKDIAEAAGADIFEIEPEQPYTDDDLNWTNSSSRVSREHDDESLRDVPLKTTEAPNWTSYDTVFIGYPIWWSIAAWPVNNFVKGNDFSGKTVIPFATSTSSGMGESGKLLEEMAGTGSWQEGQRFASGASKAMVQDWVAQLNLSK